MNEPFFSICVPQHGRTSFLLEALRVLAAQRFRDFEVCISDDASPDGRQGEIRAFLREQALAHKFVQQPRNLRYDGNLRAAIALARGRYCVLMGNDDALAGPEALGRLHAHLAALGPCGVLIPDFEDYRTGEVARRIGVTRRRGSGPDAAVASFRNFSFVSGVTLLREPAQALTTDSWDGAEMYQMYLGCRMIADGHALVEVAEPLVRKDIVVEGEAVDSVARRPRVWPCPIRERPTPLVMLGRVVAAAIDLHSRPGADGRRRNRRILSQVVRFPYPYTVLQYRRVQSWRYAVGIALGMRPERIAGDLPLTRLDRVWLRLLYGVMTAAALLVPLGLFQALRPMLYRIAKS